MTNEEAIKILERYEPIEWGNDQDAFDMAKEALSADAKPIVIRSRTLMPTKDFKEWAKRIREDNPNAVIIPCDAEVVSADAVPQLRQTDTLIIADALRYLAEDTERHELDRARAEKLREQILQYGASMCHSADVSQNLAKPNKALKGSDLISRQAAVDALKEHCGEPWTEWDAAHNAGVEDSISVIEALPSAEPKKGKWEMKPDPFGFFHDIPVCSECGCTPKMREKTKYCQNCGAKMLTKESTENLNLKADGEGVSKGGVSNGDTERHDSCSR